MTAVLDPSSHNAVFGSYDRWVLFQKSTSTLFFRLRLMSWNARRGAWDEGSLLMIRNLYSVTALAWKPDGSSIVCVSYFCKFQNDFGFLG